VRTTLTRTLAAEKPLVPHALTRRARGLGSAMGSRASRTTFDPRRRRVVHGKGGLSIPTDVLERKRTRFLRNGQVRPRAERLHHREVDSICRSQGDDRGLVADDVLAQHVARLTPLRGMMATSRLKTLAHENRPSVRQPARRLRGTAQTPYGPRRCRKITIPRAGKKPLTAIVGGLSLTSSPQTAIKDSGLLPSLPYRSEALDKRLRATWEMWGGTGAVEMPHSRNRADLHQQGRREKPRWRRSLSARRRKPLVVCRPCHLDIPSNRPTSAATGDRRAG
jgi:hypothetical protein